jgi:hypothetical protein
MARLFLILLAVLVLTGGMFLALVFGLDHFGWYPLFDPSHKIIRRNLLEFLRFLPGFLAFAASLVACAVSIRVLKLQNASVHDLESFKTDLAVKIETLRMQIGLSARDVEQMSLHLTHALKSAAAYLMLLQQLDGGVYDAEAVSEAEQKAKLSAAVLDHTSAAWATYTQFLQTGSDISDLGKRVDIYWRRKQIWKERGAQLTERFVELQARIEEARTALRSAAVREVKTAAAAANAPASAEPDGNAP